MPRRERPAHRRLRSAAERARRPEMLTRLGREPLAALGASPRNHPLTALGEHPLAEAVPPLADQSARLISALHVTTPLPDTNKSSSVTVAVGKGPRFQDCGRLYGVVSCKSTSGLSPAIYRRPAKSQVFDTAGSGRPADTRSHRPPLTPQ